MNVTGPIAQTLALSVDPVMTWAQSLDVPKKEGRAADRLPERFRGLPEALRRVRGEKSQADVGRDGKIKPQQVNRYEQGHEVPGLDAVARVLTGAGASLYDLARALDEANGRVAPPANEVREQVARYSTVPASTSVDAPVLSDLRRFIVQVMREEVAGSSSPLTTPPQLSPAPPDKTAADRELVERADRVASAGLNDSTLPKAGTGTDGE